MKNLLFILSFFILNSCTKSSGISENSINKIAKKEALSSLNEYCTSNDIALLTKKDIRLLFFEKLDSTLQKQYQHEKEKTSPELNGKILDQFLEDIDLKYFEQNFQFQKKYEFKLTPKSIHTLKEFNTIELLYYPNDCSFRLSIICFYVTKEFSDESSVVYIFKIKNNKLLDFKRQEAG